MALLSGCAQQVLAPQINEATIRLLTRHGCEVVVAKGAGCCGALTHHLGQEGNDHARANILAWSREIAAGGLDAIVINASGCGTTVKDYGFMFRDDRATSARTPCGAVANHAATPAAATRAAARPNADAIRVLMTGAAGEPLRLPRGHYCCFALYFSWQPPQFFS